MPAGHITEAIFVGVRSGAAKPQPLPRPRVRGSVDIRRALFVPRGRNGPDDFQASISVLLTASDETAVPSALNRDGAGQANSRAAMVAPRKLPLLSTMRPAPTD